MKRNRFSIILYALAAICLVIAIGLYATEPLKNYLVNGYHSKISRAMVTKDANHQKQANYNFQQVKPASLTQAVQARSQANKIRVAGQMLVPSMGIHLPIGYGVSNDVLMLGAGTMRQNEQMGHGNYALAGHHMKAHNVLFTPLWYHAHAGTLVYLTDMKLVYIYRINQRQIISPYDVGVVNNTKRSLLTLITCNDSGSKRLLLKGKLIKTKKLNQLPNALRKEFLANTNNHNVLKGY